MTDGLHGSEMIVIAGAAFDGQNVAGDEHRRKCRAGAKIAGGGFQLEMSAEALVMRMMCSIARVNLRSIREDS